MFVKPARADLIVRHPLSGRQVPPEGAEIDETDLDWARILADGDLVAAKPSRAAAAKSDADPA